MTLRSVLDVQVNDAEFQRFYVAFQQYREQLGATPKVWIDVAALTKGVGGEFDRIAASMLGQHRIGIDIMRQ